MRSALFALLLAAPAVADDAFGPTKVHAFHITVAARDYPAMDPPPANPFAPKAGRPAFGTPDAGAGNFNFAFPFVHARLDAGDAVFADIGLRYKGSGTYFVSQRNAKRSLKLDFDKYTAAAFHGLTKANLNCAVIDPTKSREALAYSLFRAAGLPAARTAFAEVTLTVPGKYDREYLGLYTLVEQADKAFLKAHFKTDKGLLLKPEGVRGLPHLGDKRAAFEVAYNAKTTGDDAAWGRLIELTRLVNKADADEFRREIGRYLDVDAFTRFLAANALAVNLDSFLGLGHNYYLYLSPTTQRFTFFPWDLDLAFAGFQMLGRYDQLADLSIDHPHAGENKLIDRLLAIPDVKAAYRGHVRRLHADLFASGKLAAEAEAIEKAIAAGVARERKAAAARGEDFTGPGQSHPFSPPATPLKAFVEKRTAAVAAQLAGTSTGYVPGAKK